MALKVEKDGQVKFIMAAGDDYVMSSMPEEDALRMMQSAKKRKRTDLFPEYPLCINEKYYFPEAEEVEEGAEAEETPKKQKR